ncbi:MAG: tyrosine-type recombinase/integrase [Betaproteobacteria bacterium]|nr:tyrosine-type recombinase/integrase [Betaproteobacteria bacterium]
MQSRGRRFDSDPRLPPILAKRSNPSFPLDGGRIRGWGWCSTSSILRVCDCSAAVVPARDKLGLKDLRLHDLRHEATSTLFEKGLSPIEVATMTGHKTLNTLKRYTHPNVTEIARKLG